MGSDTFPLEELLEINDKQLKLKRLENDNFKMRQQIQKLTIELREVKKASETLLARLNDFMDNKSPDYWGTPEDQIAMTELQELLGDKK